MSEGLSKSLSIVLYVLLGISAILGALFYAGTVSSETIIYWCYVLFALAAVSAIVFPVMTIVKNPAGGKIALIGIIALAAVFGISYALAGDEMTTKYEEFISGPAASKRVGMGLIAFYILAVGAIAATVWTGVTKIIK